jgi:hypothetical protein
LYLVKIMIDKKAIDNALYVHAQWRNRLHAAIETGTSEFDPEKVAPDNLCEFGKWLYSLPEEDQATDDFKSIKEKHADFHKMASEILSLAVSGKKEEALSYMGAGGKYNGASGKLVLSLSGWKSKLT